MTNRLEVGGYNKLPHYAVVGRPVEFYVWVNEGSSPYSGRISKWYKGAEAFSHWHKMLKMTKPELVGYIKELHGTT